MLYIRVQDNGVTPRVLVNELAPVFTKIDVCIILEI